jgi:hypothetical protein
VSELLPVGKGVQVKGTARIGQIDRRRSDVDGDMWYRVLFASEGYKTEWYPPEKLEAIPQDVIDRFMRGES